MINWSLCGNIYAAGMFFFILHFLFINSAVLKRKGVILPLVIYTVFWPGTYLFSLWLNHSKATANAHDKVN